MFVFDVELGTNITGDMPLRNADDVFACRGN